MGQVMAISVTMTDNDAAFMIADLPDAFAWKGSDYVCLAGMAANGTRQELEGVLFTPDIVIVVRTALFTAAHRPRPHDKITFKGQPMNIGIVNTAEDGITLELHCSGYLNEK